MKNEYKQNLGKQVFILLLAFILVFTMMPMTAFAEANDEISSKFDVTDSDSKALSVEKVTEIEGSPLYCVDASGKSARIATDSYMLIDARTNMSNVSDEGFTPLNIAKPSEEIETTIQECADISEFLKQIDLNRDQYDKLSVICALDLELEKIVAYFAVRWTKDDSVSFELEGEGTKDSPFIIESTDHLVQISKNVANGKNYKDNYFKIADTVGDEGLTLPADWVPIGCLKDGVSEYGKQDDENRLQSIEQTHPFSGNFNGNGKTIHVAENGLPLFGSINGATIENLNIFGKKIRGYGLVEYYAVGATGKIDGITIKSGSHILRSGLLGGYGNESVDISNCIVEENVIIGDDGTWGDLGDTTFFYDYVGEINHQDCIGSFTGAWNGNITNCVSYATVYGRNNVGGIAGFKGQSMRSFAVTDCAFYGEIKATGSMVGGIVGNGYTAASGPNTICVTIENCFATGKITGADNVGGIFGGEGGSAYCWGNGIGRIRNNYFAGTVTATEANANVGGIIGYMKSLDRYNDIRDNYYVEECGAENGVGGVGFIVDKTYKPKSSYQHYGRDDDPLGKGAEVLAKKIQKDDVKNGTLLQYLQAGTYGGSWIQNGKAYPEIGSEKHIIGILSRSYGKNQLEANPEITLSLNGDAAKLQDYDIYVRYSDGSEETVKASECKISGIDFSKEGYQLAVLTYQNYELTFGVQIIDRNKKTIKVQVSVYGFDPQTEDDTKHSMSAKNLESWIDSKVVSIWEDGTALDAIKSACSSEKDVVMSALSEDDENITSVVRGDVTLRNGANGKEGTWIYTVNGLYTNVPLGKQTLKENDNIVLHYSEDQETDYKNAKKEDPAPIAPSEDQVKVKFRLIGAEKAKQDVNLSDSEYLPNYVTWIATTNYTLPEGSTVYDLFTKATARAGLKNEGAGSNYVKTIQSPSGTWLGEFDNGAYSGWMYTINGAHPNVGLLYYTLQDGDEVIWHYVNDYRWEVEDWFSDPKHPSLAQEKGITKYYNGWLKAADVAGGSGGGMVEQPNDVTTDTSVGTTTAPTEVKVSEKAATDGTKEKVAEVKVSADNQKEILKQAKDNKVKEIILVVSKNDVKDAAKADAILDKSFLESIVKDTNAKLTIKTPFGDKTYTQDELKTLIASASGTTVTLTIEKSEELDEAAKLEKAKELTASLTLTARSAKTAKKNVKVTVKMNSKTTAAIQELKDLGYTVKYRYYRSTKKASAYKSAMTKSTKTYINTAGTKGKMYYYKAQVRVYDENGKLIAKTALKQCKYANRTWSR